MADIVLAIIESIRRNQLTCALEVIQTAARQ
jgi:hypothetical protein